MNNKVWWDYIDGFEPDAQPNEVVTETLRNKLLNLKPWVCFDGIVNDPANLLSKTGCWIITLGSEALDMIRPRGKHLVLQLTFLA